MPERDELQSRIYDSLVAFNSVACWDILRLAQMRQYLAEHLADTFAEQAAEIDRLRQDNRAAHASEQILQQQIDAQAKEIDRLRAELAQTVGQRDYWHAELMCADARILELQRQAEALRKGGA